MQVVMDKNESTLSGVEKGHYADIAVSKRLRDACRWIAIGMLFVDRLLNTSYPHRAVPGGAVRLMRAARFVMPDNLSKFFPLDQEKRLARRERCVPLV